MKTYKIGIIGTATIVDRFTAGVRESGRATVYAIAGRTLEKAKEFSKRLDIPYYYGNYSEILENPEIDLIYIATYNNGHYEPAKEAIKHHKHVLCEKPMTISYQQSEELFSLARKHGVFLMEAQKSVFLPAVQEVKKLIEAKVLGEIQWINIISSHITKARGEWFKTLQNGGGILHGAGTYPLEFIRTVFNEKVEDVDGTLAMTPPTSDDSVIIKGRLGVKTLVSILISKDIVEPSRVEIHGTRGKLIIPNYWKTDRFIDQREGMNEEKVFKMDSEFVYEIRHVLSCLDEGYCESPVMRPKVTLEAIEIINAIYRSELRRYHIDYDF